MTTFGLSLLLKNAVNWTNSEAYEWAHLCSINKLPIPPLTKSNQRDYSQNMSGFSKILKWMEYNQKRYSLQQSVHQITLKLLTWLPISNTLQSWRANWKCCIIFRLQSVRPGEIGALRPLFHWHSDWSEKVMGKELIPELYTCTHTHTQTWVHTESPCTYTPLAFKS